MKKFRVTVNGQTYDVEVEELENGSLLDEKSQSVEVKHPIKSVVESNDSESDWIKIEAPMQGKIVLIPVSDGQEIEKGAVVAVLEAMKMENEIIAPISGKIVSIDVAAGQAVEAGDVLVSLG